MVLTSFEKKNQVSESENGLHSWLFYVVCLPEGGGLL